MCSGTAWLSSGSLLDGAHGPSPRTLSCLVSLTTTLSPVFGHDALCSLILIISPHLHSPPYVQSVSPKKILLGGGGRAAMGIGCLLRGN